MSTNQRIIRYESLLPETEIGFLGPKGTFAEQALLSEADLAATQVRPYDSIPDVLNALVTEEVDLGFVPIENAIEGAVNVTQDSIAFDLDLKIHREVVFATSNLKKSICWIILRILCHRKFFHTTFSFFCKSA